METFGELLPSGGGDPIPLMKKTLLIGRRENCDIVLRFANVSSHHCLLSVEEGYWFVQDQNSRNGVKVNGDKITRKRLDPGDTLSVAKHEYTIQYEPGDLGAMGPPPSDDEKSVEVLNASLLERAGLIRRREQERRSEKRFDVASDENDNFKDPNEPI